MNRPDNLIVAFLSWISGLFNCIKKNLLSLLSFLLLCVKVVSKVVVRGELMWDKFVIYMEVSEENALLPRGWTTRTIATSDLNGKEGERRI
jgi:hypothetical protein